MWDELNRSMDSLDYKDFGKPFFVAYRFDQNEVLNVSATLGAITGSNHTKLNNKSVRLMMGDYQMNDENYYSNSSFNGGGNSAYMPTPLEIDYYGIRRSFWVSSDEVYKSAGELYKTKLSILEKHNLSKDDYKIPDFAKAPVVKSELPQPIINFDKGKWEDIARKISSVFLDFPEITYSGVYITIFSGRDFFINSEGTEVIQPIVRSSVTISASADVESGPPVSDAYIINVGNPEDFPAEDILIKETKAFANYLMELKSAPVFEDIYSGPVLFEGKASADLFNSSLFGHTGLIAKRQEMSESANMISIPDKPSVNSVEAKIGKKVINRDLTVIATPKIKLFNDIKLIGSFEIDGDGVIPPDTLTLVAEGILEALLNDRTPSTTMHKLNGHNRLGLSGMGMSRSVSPGVIQVSSTNTKTREELLQQLFDLADEEDLEYVFVVKKIGLGYLSAAEVYKLNIADGTEQLVRGANLGLLDLKLLKKICGISGDITVYNTNSPGGYMGGGSLASYIVPNTVLIKELEIKGVSQSTTNKLPVVRNPLLK